VLDNLVTLNTVGIAVLYVCWSVRNETTSLKPTVSIFFCVNELHIPYVNA
jgi:hypothetical protein